MKRVLLATTIVASVLVGGSAANATCVSCTPTDATFFTPAFDGLLTFTFEGFEAADTEFMSVVLGNVFVFDNHAAKPGDIFTFAVTAGTPYELSIKDLSTSGNFWFSNPADNIDAAAHLMSTGIFGDFHLPIGPMPPAPVSANCAIASQCYLGWEDRRFPGADGDYNDLVFALQFTAVPEPTTLALVGSGLLGFAAMRRFRNRGKERSA